MKKIELLAPAGSLEKLKIAILYGADAVYIGGKSFSLRARANNFSLEDIKEGCQFAYKHNARVYVTMNIIPHEEDFAGLEEYLLYLESVGVSAIITSSMYIVSVCKKICKNLETHLSTQLSITNSMSCNFYQENFGVERVVLGRETSIEEMRNIRKNTNCEIEVFIHGGMCSSYSGRCMLSNYMVNRDANRGGCAHSCRWNYDLYDDTKINDSEYYFNIGSKDLCAINHIKELIDLGVDSLKIEGRMKSAYYIATIVKCYRKIIDKLYQNSNIDYSYYEQEINKAENRLTSIGFLEGDPSINEQLYDTCEIPSKEFVGVVVEYNKNTKECIIEQRNFFKVGDTLEFFGPNLENSLCKVTMIKDINDEILDAARHPLQLIKMTVDIDLKKDDMVRLFL